VRHPAEAPCVAAGNTLLFGAERAAASDAEVDPLIGTRAGSFQIVRLLGRGGMGTVYLAEHPVIGSRVAVKFLHEAMAREPATVERFYDEARAVNLIGHENIVGIYDLSVLPPSRYYFVMEYLEGATLGDVLRAGPVSAEVGLDVLLQLCDALQCAHERGVVHRDLKPDNVFLVHRHGRDNFVKLVDFGVAKLRGARPTERTTEAGVIVGTPEYMAPEQCQDVAIDARTDVYALGVMAFELATGRLPFAHRSVTQLLLAHIGEPPPRPSDLAPVDPALERAILRALAKDPADRFQDMAAFGATLREVAERGAPLAAPPPARTPAPAPPPASAPRAEGAAPPAPPAPAPAPAPQATPAEVALPSADFRVAGGPPVPAPVVEITRAGLFLRAEKNLPPLLARVAVGLAHPSLRARLEVTAEVVRHVAPPEAEAWHMAPGFALQFVELAPEARAAISAIAGVQRRGPAKRAPAPASHAERLRALEARDGHDPYALLALPPDAEFADVRRTVRALRDELEAMRARPTAADEPGRATALLARVEAAQAALGAPASRLLHDARSGNFRGVARCLAAGVPAELVQARRRELLRSDPAREAEAQRQVARARVARKLGNLAAAVTAYEAALAADPLDGESHTVLATLRARS
jgi:serine/threonine-protein kinase